MATQHVRWLLLVSITSVASNGVKANLRHVWAATDCETQSFHERIVAVRECSRRRVLVTGAAGFIGSHVATFTSQRLGWETIAADDLSGGCRRNVGPNITFVQVDLKDPEAVRALFRVHGPFDYVYHLAAYAAEGLSHFIRRFNYRNNLEASVSLINEAVVSKVRVFVFFTSSIAAFGTNILSPK